MAMLAHRTTTGHPASPPSTSTSTAAAAAAATMTASSPPSPAGPPPWDAASSSRACFSDLAAVDVVLVCFSCVGVCIHYAARVLLRCLDRRRRRDAEQAQEPKPASDADADGGSAGAGASPVAAGVWAEAECAICLGDLDVDDDLEAGERVRVLPACGHGFHAACVEAWLATRASCPTCRAPSRTTTRSSAPASTSRSRQAAA